MVKWRGYMKKIIFLLLPLFMVGLCSAFFAGKSADAAGEAIDIVLHKRIFRDVRWRANENLDSWFYDNDGLPIDKEKEDGQSQDNTLLENSVPLNGAQYKIWDATKLVDVATFKKYYHDSEIQDARDIVQVFSRMTRSNAIKIAENAQLPQMSIANSKTVVTKNDVITKDNPASKQAGIARFTNLPRKEGDTFKAYLIVETAVSETKELNVDLEKFAKPILVTLPVMANNEELTEIHLYPKNVGYVRDPYFYKFGQNRSGENLGALAGATFVLYREESGKRLYLDMSPTTDLKNKWVESEDPLNDERVNKFISDETGLVNTGERFLPSGTFYFEEVQAANGYEITAEARKVEVVIPATWEEAVTINGQKMEELITGIVPEAAQQKQMPRVYNTQNEAVHSQQETSNRLRLPQTLGQLVATVEATTRRMLPRTNEGKAAFSVIGVIILIGAIFLWRKKNEDN